MTKYDRISTLFFVGLAIAVSLESIQIGPGSLSNPGPGLIPLGSGLVLGILGVIGFFRTFVRPSKEGRPDNAVKFGGRTISALVSMTAFALLIDTLGFLIVTFLWMGFVCRWIARMGWKGTIFTSLVTPFCTWLLFEYFLEIRFPRGILSF
jgi:putative tricarboxylic transport membrane protein